MGAPSWLDELELDVGGSVHSMRTRALDRRSWLAPARGDDALLALKREILLQHRTDVVGALDAFDRHNAAASAAISTTGASLEEAALTTAEDVCVLARAGGPWILVGGVVCFPSMWRLPDKLGLSVARVHGPVPRYARELELRVDRFLDRLRPGRPVWRRNWFVHDVPDLYLPRRPVPVPDVDRPPVPVGLWLRSERQTLARLEDDVIVFTIRTQQVPLAVVAERPHIAGRMARVVRSWPEDVVSYRGATGWSDDLASWLDGAAVAT